MRIRDWSSDVCSSDLSEAAIRDVRLAIVAVLAGALIITVLLSFYLAGTIARPVLRLAAAAERVRHGIGREMQQIPDFTHRRDEIGDLSGVLREMTAALYLRMEAIERFAADVSRSEARRVGKECVRTCRSRWAQYP